MKSASRISKLSGRKTIQQQLVRIKLLYRQSLLHTDKADEVNLILLVQILDFVVETFLKLVIHHFPKPQTYNPPQSSYYHKISQMNNKPYSPRLDFFRTWDEVVGIIRDPGNNLPIVDLPMRRDIERLHEIRNDVQHKLAIPHPQDAQKYPALVESFLKSNYQDIFRVNYDSISPLSLIKDRQIKEQLEKAHTALNVKDWNKVVGESAIAFYILLKLATTIARRDIFSTQFFIDVDISRPEFNNLSSALERIVEQINDLREHLLITACGTDYIQYLKYKFISPIVMETSGKRYYVTLRKDYYSEDEAKSILNFVETQVLQFQVSGIYQDLVKQIPGGRLKKLDEYNKSSSLKKNKEKT